MEESLQKHYMREERYRIDFFSLEKVTCPVLQRREITEIYMDNRRKSVQESPKRFPQQSPVVGGNNFDEAVLDWTSGNLVCQAAGPGEDDQRSARCQTFLHVHLGDLPTVHKHSNRFMPCRGDHGRGA
jgi:hypothetical protein